MTSHLKSVTSSVHFLDSSKARYNDDVLYIDLVDPDNVLTALCFAKMAYKKNIVAHIVCTGRPVCFDLARFNPKSMTFKHAQTNKEQKMDFKVNVREASHENEFQNKTDSELLLAGNIISLIAILQKDLSDEVFKNLHIYNGLVAPIAGLSHAVHDYEDLFTYVVDNGSVIDFKIRNSEEYFELVTKLYDASPRERRVIREANAYEKITFGALNGYRYKVHNLDELEQVFLKTNETRIFLGGPCTALAKLLRSPECPMMKKKFDITAMMCSLPEDCNLLGDNFNIKTDPNAFETVFFNALSENRLNVSHNVNFIPTGVCKQGWLNFDSDQISTLGMDTFSDLHTLWTVLKRAPQPMFDIAVLFEANSMPFAQTYMRLSQPDTSVSRIQFLPVSDEKSGTCVRLYILTQATDVATVDTHVGLSLLTELIST